MIRAVAIASDRADIVGTVELACGPAGLVLSFVRAAAFAADYVPSIPLSGQKTIVPYAAIREAWDDGETLRLTLDAPKVPYKHLVLAHFTRDRGLDHRALHRRRVRWELAMSVGAAAFAAAAITATSWAGGGVLAGSVATFVSAFGGLTIARAVGRSKMLGSEPSTQERKAFFQALRAHLPGELVTIEAPVERPIARAVGEASSREERGLFGEVGPVLLGAFGSAVVMLVAMFAGARLFSGSSGESSRTNDSQAASLNASVDPTEPIVPEPPPITETNETCTCQIPSSFAIPARVPRVTVLQSVVKRRTDPTRPSLVVEVAAVNNSSSPLRDVQGVVDFLAPPRKPGNPLRVRAEKGVYYEGPLAPGAAIKWRVGARGVDSRVSLRGADDLLDDGDLASADAFAKLLSAHTRSVRIHGAAMLARMRDERAAAAIEKLREDAREDEIDVLASLSRASATVFACDVVVGAPDGGASAVSACVMNAGDDPAGPLDATLALTRKKAGEDGGHAVASIPIAKGFRLPPRTGARIHGTADVPPDDEAVAEIIVEAR